MPTFQSFFAGSHSESAQKGEFSLCLARSSVEKPRAPRFLVEKKSRARCESLNCNQIGFSSWRPFLDLKDGPETASALEAMGGKEASIRRLAGSDNCGSGGFCFDDRRGRSSQTSGVAPFTWLCDESSFGACSWGH